MAAVTNTAGMYDGVRVEKNFANKAIQPNEESAIKG